MSFIETGETSEMFHVRVQLLLQKGYQDLALNLCSWCVKSSKYWYDTYLRAVQLNLLHSKGDLDTFTKVVRHSVPYGNFTEGQWH